MSVTRVVALGSLIAPSIAADLWAPPAASTRIGAARTDSIGTDMTRWFSAWSRMRPSGDFHLCRRARDERRKEPAERMSEMSSYKNTVPESSNSGGSPVPRNLFGDPLRLIEELQPTAIISQRNQFELVTIL